MILINYFLSLFIKFFNLLTKGKKIILKIIYNFFEKLIKKHFYKNVK